jgi:hypothetical protein
LAQLRALARSSDTVAAVDNKEGGAAFFFAIPITLIVLVGVLLIGVKIRSFYKRRLKKRG